MIHYVLILAALALLAETGAGAWRAARRRDAGQGAGAAVLACTALALLGIDGVLKPAAAAVLGILAAATAAGIVYASPPAGRADPQAQASVLRSLAGEAGAAFGQLGADIRALAARARPAAGSPALPAQAAGHAGGERRLPDLGGDYGPVPGPGRQAPAGPPTNGRVQQPAIRARRVAAATGLPAVPGEWGAVVSAAVDFRAESNIRLVEWMVDQVMGIAAYGEGVVEQHDANREEIGVDPAAISALHDVADAVVACSEQMAAAVVKFCNHYELPDAFVDDGGKLAHDGAWHQGSPL